MRHFKLTLEYDGTAYHGWQVQPLGPTVQGVVQEALARIAGAPVHLMGAGRTDAGVHARGQVASFGAALRLDAATLRRALNATLPPDVAVQRVEEVGPDFDARRSARARRYRYSLLRREARSALLGRYSVWLPQPLALEPMREAAACLVGSHDFSAFRAGTCAARSPVREVTEAGWHEAGECWHFEIRANGFLQQMVRIIVGTLLEVGRGRRPPAFVAEVLAGRDRRTAAKAAPAHGLCLMEVEYDQPRPSAVHRRPSATAEPDVMAEE